jgi:hypothetical protein
MRGLPRFGLPPLPTEPETAMARLKRQARVHRNAELVLTALFGALRAHLGEEEARRLFEPPPRNGRGVSDAERDRELLDRYDVLGVTPSALAEICYAEDPRRFGNSPEAIEKHIRRLVDKREKREAEKREFERLTEELLAAANTHTPQLQALLAEIRPRRGPGTLRSSDK